MCVAVLTLDLSREWFERSAPLLDPIVSGTQVVGGWVGCIVDLDASTFPCRESNHDFSDIQLVRSL